MKGITPVVAIILLLLITISMVGFAFVWFTRIGELTTQQTQTQLQSQLDAAAQKVRIDSIDKTNPMKAIYIEKVTLNIGAGKNEDLLKKGLKLLQKIASVRQDDT